MLVLGGADGFVRRVTGLVFSVDATGMDCVVRFLPSHAENEVCLG